MNSFKTTLLKLFVFPIPVSGWILKLHFIENRMQGSTRNTNAEVSIRFNSDAKINPPILLREIKYLIIFSRTL